MALKWIVMGILLGGVMDASRAEERDFFPLEVGNRWVFQQYDRRYENWDVRTLAKAMEEGFLQVDRQL